MRIDEDLLVLQHQATRLTLDPRRGGTIHALNWRGYDVLRPTPANAGDDPFDTACFAMVPFVNRVAHGQFNYGGQAVRLEPNWSNDPHPLHGQAWREPWTIISGSTSSVTIRFEGGSDEWPWRYRCDQYFQLRPDGLSVELSIENLSETLMPAMLGLHPYFPDAAHAQLQAQLPRVWRTDDAALPLEEIQTPPDWGFDPARPVNAVLLDHGFSGWNGTAMLRWPDRTVRVFAPECRFLHVYAPAQRDFFCVEPQTAAPGALSRGGGEATAVAPGQRFSIRVHFLAGAS
jgi:aldose 1-epimerase